MLWQVDTAGGYIKVAQAENFPVSEHMSGALVRFAPGALRQLHWHPGHAEWQYVINGTLTVRCSRCGGFWGVVSRGFEGFYIHMFWRFPLCPVLTIGPCQGAAFIISLVPKMHH